MPLIDENFTQPVLDSLSAHVAVIDEAGRIVYVNRAWTEFARANGATSLQQVGVGANYLESCRPAKDAADDVSVIAARAGIETVLAGEEDHFEMEYPCHSPQEGRWFLLQARSVQFENQPHVVITHHNITAQYQFTSPTEAETRVEDARLNQLELDSLEELSQSAGTHVTAGLLGVASLRGGAPDLFGQLVEQYQLVLEQALDQRLYKVEHPVADKLRVIAERLGFSRSGPRDVIDMHTTALRARLEHPTQPARAYFEESRILVLELMGYLVAYYRNYAVGVRRAPAAAQGKPPNSQGGNRNEHV